MRFSFTGKLSLRFVVFKVCEKCSYKTKSLPFKFRTLYLSQLESAEILKISFKLDPGKMVSV
jgi:hypothetical protein